MALPESSSALLLFVLSCCVSTCLAADSTFSGPLVGVVVVVGLLLSAITAVAVILLIVWMKWQRESNVVSVRLQSTAMKEEEGGEMELDERKEEEGRREEENHWQSPPAYAVVNRVPRPASPDDSFTSDDGGNRYSNIADMDIQLKPTRHAPSVPTMKEELKKEEIAKSATNDSMRQDVSSSKPARRPPPPKPKVWGEVEPAINPQKLMPVPPAKRKEAEPDITLPKLKPVPPAKPKEADNPLKQKPVPPAKPKEEEPSPLSVKLKPVPAAKPPSKEPPAKPHSREPPAPPSKPATPGPGTKPKPLPKPVGGSTSDSPTQSTPPKPKIKPRVPTKPSGVGSEVEGTSARVPVAKFGEHVASLHSDNNTGFSQQYDSLPTGEAGRPIFDGIMPQHARRNRYHHIIPYNDNRPKLKPIPGNREFLHDYINASYIDGLSNPHKYIAAQGPKLETVIDFWRMIWQEKVPTIAMVTGLREGSSCKLCERYWPEFGTVEYGPYRVSLTNQQVLANYILSTLEVQVVNHGRHSVTHKPRTLQHIQFSAWPDNDSPAQVGPFLSYLRRLHSLHKPNIGPLLVHCSVGVGRTGSLLAIDLALEQAGKEGYVDIPAIVTSLRRQRMKMVQSQHQYRFIHDAVLEQLVCGDTQIRTPDFRRALEKLKQQELKDGVFKTGFAVQFDVLQQVSPKPEDVLRQTAMLYPNKNRSTKYLPPDESRVSLRDQTPGYIHASFVHGYRQKHAFIISQAPLEETCRDFWKMVYERECGVIVMLSAPVKEEQLCAQYWSEKGDGSVRQFAELSIHTTECQQMSGYVIHRMIITNRRSGTKREVVQFQVMTWTGDNVCSSPSSLVEAIHHIRAAQRKSGNKPIVVHGSDTVSRCGVFCALVITIDQCMTEGVVDVFQAVKALRLHKPGSVRTLVQYQSLFQLMTVYLDSFDTYANFK